jgi:molybdopterin converting factor small subunit
MSIEVQYFGLLAETAGKATENIELSGSKSKVLDSVLERHPGLEKLNFVVSLNGTVSHHEAEIHDGDRITLIPPAPGG